MKRTTKGPLCALALIATAACGEEELSPVPTASATVEPPDAGPTGGSPPVGPRVRDVFVRNPFGGPLQNLLADGDFELSIVPSQAAGGQYGWIALSPNGSSAIGMNGETGGLCRTGLRCGRVGANNLLFGRGTAAPGMVGHHASIWMKPLGEVSPDKPCGVATVMILGCDAFDIKKTLKAADAPDAQGFCEIAGDVVGSRSALCFYVEVGGVDVLADSATLLPLPEDASPPPPSPVEADPATLARIARVRDYVRSHAPVTPLPLPPRPSPTGEAGGAD